MLDQSEQRKATAEQHARQQRVAARIRRIQQRYAPLCSPSLRRL